MLLFCFLNSNAQGYLEFVENKGQWADNISYKGALQTGAIALKPDGGYRMLQHNTTDLEAIHNFFHPDGSDLKGKAVSTNTLGLHSHVYEVSFLGSNKSPQAIAEKPQESYNNYYLGNDPTHWASGCKIFQAITYKNIYPNIDVRYYTGNGTVKYDFIVNPGGNPKLIAMVFDGADELTIKKGKLNIKTSVTEEKELAPFTFQPSINGRKAVDCKYKIKANIVTFNIDSYDKSLPLIIDPTKVFSTFTGSTADNWGFTATYDAAGNFYAGGIVFDAGFPVSNGSTYQGGIDSDDGNKFDIGIIKFNSTGTGRIYATYIGGSANEQPHSLIVDNNGNLVIAGRTNSTNYPVTIPNSGPCGDKDIIITKLDNAGNMMASKKIGGTGDDGMNIKPKYSNIAPTGLETINRNYGDDARSEVIVDDANNILLASCTQSTDFFVTPNAFQKNNGGASTLQARKQDAVFIRMSNDLTNVLISTYLGGNRDDAAFVLAIHPLNKNIYLAGGTASGDFPGDTTGVINTKYQGGQCDGFISILSPDGTQLLKSCFMGTSGGENVYGIQFDKNGFPYIMGITTGNWPIINAQYNTPFSRQFISKLKPDLSGYVYSTSWGTVSPAPNISPVAFLVDRCENVYISGWGGSINTNSNHFYPSSGTSGLPITANALQKTTDGNDFYFFVLERNARSQLYGDFFGQFGGANGEHVDGGTSRFDKDGIIYQSLCANCGKGAVFPTTPGAYSTVNGSTNCNLAAVKINLNLSGIANGVRSSIKGVEGDTSGCVPLLVKFVDTIAQGVKYTWNFGDGSPEGSTTKPDTFHYYQNIGLYKVRLISIDSSTCNIVDTSYLTMRIRSDSAKLNLAFKKVGDCISNTYEFDNRGSVFPPLKPFKNNSFKINFGDGSPTVSMGFQAIQHNYPIPGIYKIIMTLVDTNYCNEPESDSVIINVIDRVKANFTPPTTGCLSSGIKFVHNSVGSDDVVWHFGDGSTSNLDTAVHIYNNSGNYTIKLFAYNLFSCNKVDSVSYTISISISPTANFTYNPLPPRVNTAINFTNKSTGAIKYVWSFGDGDTIITNNINQQIKHLFQVNKLFKTCLTVYNMFGCPDTMCKNIQARVSSLYDVPSAFSPNGNGINDKIYVKGYGIRKISWNIYNRWGILMFSTNDLAEGWDGKYKGEIQPQDVYHYTLIVDFYDDKKETKTGDITLLR